MWFLTHIYYFVYWWFIIKSQFSNNRSASLCLKLLIPLNAWLHFEEHLLVNMPHFKMFQWVLKKVFYSLIKSMRIHHTGSLLSSAELKTLQKFCYQYFWLGIYALFNTENLWLYKREITIRKYWYPKFRRVSSSANEN